MRLYMDVDRIAESAELELLRSLVKRAGRHEPVQYLVGRWSFFGFELEVGSSTLIPRPSTESLVSLAIERLRAVNDANAGPLRIADLCTGSGCIAIAIARSLMLSQGGRRQLAWQRGSAGESGELLPAPDESAVERGRVCEVYATESSAPAAALAQRNVDAHKLGAVITIEVGDLDRPFVGRGFENSFDLIVSNPPYISDVEWAEVPRNVREFEPESALRGGIDGLDMVRRVLSCAPIWLKPRGTVLVEISSSQGAAAAAIAASHGLTEIEIRPDLEGHPRVLAARTDADTD